jgi:hypothetical protein
MRNEKRSVTTKGDLVVGANEIHNDSIEIAILREMFLDKISKKLQRRIACRGALRLAWRLGFLFAA